MKTIIITLSDQTHARLTETAVASDRTFEEEVCRRLDQSFGDWHDPNEVLERKPGYWKEFEEDDMQIS